MTQNNIRINATPVDAQTSTEHPDTLGGTNSGGLESKLGPLGTAAIYCPIVPAMGDCEDGELFGGMKIDRGNRSTRRKPAPAPLCPPQIPLE
jgi:hypothetical protein